MNTDEADPVVAAAKARGLTLYLRPDGSPAIRGDRELITPALLQALKEYREEVVAILRNSSPPPEKSAPEPKEPEPPPSAHMVVTPVDCEPAGMAEAFAECVSRIRRLRTSGRRALSDLAGTYEAVVRAKYAERHDDVFGAAESLREITLREGLT